MDENFVPPVTNTEQSTGLTPTPEKKIRSKAPIVWAVVIILLIAAGAGAYWWRNDQATTQQAAQEAKIADLQSQIDELNKPIDTDVSNSDVSEGLTEADKDSIEASIISGNTATLDGYMASEVSVIIAASEGIGPRTPSEAINDLVYIESAVDPWDFDLGAMILGEYALGDYKEYFKTDSIVGRSADNKVIVFNFNSAGKIDGIFMTIDASFL